MHECQPKGYAHRDIKIENVLLNNKKFKLCDFGSASSSTLDFEKEGALLTSHQIDSHFEDFEKYTTLMYRPPEMIDKYKRFAVSV
jgi:AP2-associated kinase